MRRIAYLMIAAVTAVACGIEGRDYGVPNEDAETSAGAANGGAGGSSSFASTMTTGPATTAVGGTGPTTAGSGAVGGGTEASDGAIDPLAGPGFCGDVMTPVQKIGKYGYIESVTTHPESSILRVVKVVLRSNAPYIKDGIYVNRSFSSDEARQARCVDDPSTLIKEGTNYICGDLAYTTLVNNVSKEIALGAICGVSYGGQDADGFAIFYVALGIGGMSDGAAALDAEIDQPPHSGSVKMVFLKSQGCGGVDYLTTRCGHYISGQ